MPVTLYPFMTDTLPYVSVAGFKAHPTYLDLNNLRSLDNVQTDQDRELHQILMQASNWADSICKLPLSGHLQTDVARLRPDRFGRVYLYPDHAPVRSLQAYRYGTQPGQYPVTASLPSVSIEQNRQMVVTLAGAAFVSWSGPLQLNSPGPSDELFFSWDYVAGFMNSQLSVTAPINSSSITISDPTALLPGDIFRVWDPGAEEALIVANSYVPNPVWPPVATAIPLAANTVFAHTASTAPGSEVRVSALPADAYLAVIYLAIDILQRYGSADNIFPGMPIPSATMNRDRPNSLWVQRAIQLLSPFMDVR